MQKLNPEQAAAANWFIDRFVESSASRNMAKRINGLEEMTLDQRKKLGAVRARNKRHDFQFLPTAFKLAVIPNTAEAEWSRGVIWFDHEQNMYCYMTTKRQDLFLEMDVRT